MTFVIMAFYKKFIIIFKIIIGTNYNLVLIVILINCAVDETF